MRGVGRCVVDEQVHKIIILIDADDFDTERSLNVLLFFFSFAAGMRWTNECHDSYRASAFFLFSISRAAQKVFHPSEIPPTSSF